MGGMAIKNILCVLCVLCVHSSTTWSAETPVQPVIAIIIDDIGDSYDAGKQVIELPGPVACAFLPHTPYARELALAAHAQNKEVMLHLPLEAVAGKALGPGGLTLKDTEQRFRETVRANIAAIPYVRGVNNHMGSLLTRHPGAMEWLMDELLAAGNLFFIDSYTTVSSVALQLAYENGIPAARRDVFLDSDPAPGEVRYQFERLLALARRDGHAIAIGHPYPVTLELLGEQLPRLESQGVKLVPVLNVIQLREQEVQAAWQASSSPSPTAVKN